MRIIAGSAKGVRLGPVPPSVRPISDRAREGLFSSLGGETVAGAAVLDLFAGTGAAGIEALSRGAASAVFVDRASAAVAAIERNLAIAKFGARAGVHRDAVARFLARGDRPGAPFDLVVCDPPYDVDREEMGAMLRALTEGWLDDGAGWTVVVTRGHRSSTFVIPLQWALVRELRYGDTLVFVFRSTGSA